MLKPIDASVTSWAYEKFEAILELGANISANIQIVLYPFIDVESMQWIYQEFIN